MSRSVTLLFVKPELVARVFPILEKVHEEHVYNSSKKLSYYIKEYSKHDRYQIGEILFDFLKKGTHKKREGSEIKYKETESIETEIIKFAYFPKIGEESVYHVIAVLTNERIFNSFGTIIAGLVDDRPFYRMQFTFTVSNEGEIRNSFDDIIKIRGEDVIDDSITDLSLKGSRLYESNEYQLAYTGEVKYLGLRMEIIGLW